MTVPVFRKIIRIPNFAVILVLIGDVLVFDKGRINFTAASNTPCHPNCRRARHNEAPF
ncbi:MAG: hypothetical protein LBQ50_12665 [Planctomycetaceae bacterium]|jgi:hypothetical protein|nr:hypothetical protein [Planctomycetaceae bacterium]